MTGSVYFTEIGTSHVIIFTCLSEWDGNSCSAPRVWVGRRNGKEILETLGRHIEIMVEALCFQLGSSVIEGDEYTGKCANRNARRFERAKTEPTNHSESGGIEVLNHVPSTCPRDVFTYINMIL